MRKHLHSIGFAVVSLLRWCIAGLTLCYRFLWACIPSHSESDHKSSHFTVRRRRPGWIEWNIHDVFYSTVFSFFLLPVRNSSARKLLCNNSIKCACINVESENWIVPQKSRTGYSGSWLYTVEEQVFRFLSFFSFCLCCEWFSKVLYGNKSRLKASFVAVTHPQLLAVLARCVLLRQMIN